MDDTNAAITYGPKRTRRWFICILTLGVGLVLLASTGIQWFHQSDIGAPNDPAAGVAGAVSFLFGLAILVTIIRRVPQLTIDQDGVTVSHLFGRKHAPWSRLGPFSMATAFAGRRTLRQAIAPMASAARPNVADKTFTIPDGFDTALEVIVTEIAARRGRAYVDADMAASAAPLTYGVAGFRWAWLTFGLLAIFIAVFALEQLFPVDPPLRDLTPSIGTLVAFGGVSRDLVAQGQWWRVLTAPFVHASMEHILANGIAFVLAGYTLERLVGRAWMFSIFALGALAGSLASMTIQSPTTVSVGASGAIMAMLVALFVISFRLPSGQAKTRTQMRTARMAIPALIPLGHSSGGLVIDYGAHAGGAALGAVLGLLVLRAWHGRSPLPRFQAGARVVAMVGAVCFVGSAGAAAWRYASYASVAHLIPRRLYPNTDADRTQRWASLLAAYPQDPRAHLIAGSVKADRNDATGAEQEYRTALHLAEDNGFLFKPTLATSIRGTLALAVLAQGRKHEAVGIAQLACSAQGDAAPEPDLLQEMQQAGLCGDDAGASEDTDQ